MGGKRALNLIYIVSTFMFLQFFRHGANFKVLVIIIFQCPLPLVENSLLCFVSALLTLFGASLCFILFYPFLLGSVLGLCSRSQTIVSAAAESVKLNFVPTIFASTHTIRQAIFLVSLLQLIIFIRK